MKIDFETVEAIVDAYTDIVDAVTAYFLVCEYAVPAVFTPTLPNRLSEDTAFVDELLWGMVDSAWRELRKLDVTVNPKNVAAVLAGAHAAIQSKPLPEVFEIELLESVENVTFH